MKLIKITLSAGTEIYVNPDHIASMRKDIQSDAHTLIQIYSELYKVKLNLQDALKLFNAEIK